MLRLTFHSKYEAFSFTSRFDFQSEINEIANKFCMPDAQFIFYLPSKVDHSCNTTRDLRIFRDTLDGGLRFSLHPFIPELLCS